MLYVWGWVTPKKTLF